MGNAGKKTALISSPYTLLNLFSDIWESRFYILGGLLLFLCIAVFSLILITPYYKSEMSVAPADPMNGADISALLSNDHLFAFRHFFQNVSPSGSGQFVHFEHTYTGPSVASVLLQDKKILEGLRQDRVFKFLQNQEQIRTSVDLAKYIKKRIKIDPIRATTMRRLSYDHPNKAFGVYFLHHVHRVTDSLIREKDRKEAGERIAYLKDAIEATRNPEHRRALTTLLLEQERKLMLVSIDAPYAASIIEPPISSNRATWPSVPFVIAVFVFAGCCLGFIVSRIIHFSDSLSQSVRPGLHPRYPGNVNLPLYSNVDAAE